MRIPISVLKGQAMTYPPEMTPVYNGTDDVYLDEYLACTIRRWNDKRIEIEPTPTGIIVRTQDESSYFETAFNGGWRKVAAISYDAEEIPTQMLSNVRGEELLYENPDDPQFHAFVESGPGQEPTTIAGCIVCPQCYQPEKAHIHS